MADIRINALATTAASTASDDFIAVDGSANGTRKLNAYSPTFGGNLTVSGTGTSAFSGAIKARSTGADEVGIGPYGTGTGGLYFGNGTVSLFNDANTQLKSLVGLSLGGNLTVSGGTVSLKTPSTTTQLDFQNPSGTTIQSIKYTDSDGSLTIGGSAGVAVPLIFTSQSGTERMRLTGSGNLGIGTTSPNKSSFSTAVTVNGATNSGFEVAVGDTRIAGFYAASSAAVLNAFANVPLYFSTNNTTQMTLTAGGNLLIGTTTDGGQKLQVSGTAAISGGIVGTTTNDSAAAGIVGQYVSSTVASGSAVSLSNGTAANVTSISLTAGDWDVSAKVGFKPNVSTTISYMLAAVSDTSAATTEANRIVLPLNGATTAYNVEATVPTVRISIASTTTIYLVASSEFAVSTQSAFGTIIARRVR